LTAPAKPSATTAINTIALMFLMDFSPLKNECGFVDRWQRHQRETQADFWR
jgi:hypothetical protein